MKQMMNMMVTAPLTALQLMAITINEFGCHGKCQLTLKIFAVNYGFICRKMANYSETTRNNVKEDIKDTKKIE